MATMAAVFAGQGAQAVGMGKDLYDQVPACKALFDTADAVLGRALSKVCFEGPAEELTKTSNCQPAIFVMSVACFRAATAGARASFAGMAGLSLGEWTALHAAGVLSFEDAVRVLEARGRFMQEACDERKGGMVSIIGLADDKVREVCRATGVEIANINSAGQIVLSGEQKNIAEAEKAAVAAGAKKAIVLNVAGAYHSSLMTSAARKLEDFLKQVTMQKPAVPVVANVTGAPHGTPDEIKATMVRQVTGSVQWVSSVEWFRRNGVTAYAEFGPGKVLSGLIKRIDGAAALSNVGDAASARAFAEAHA